jgi:hypothetical protein
MISPRNRCLRFAVVAYTGFLLITPAASADTYPWGGETVPAETLEDITKYYFYKHSDDAYNKRWGDLQVIVVPEMTLEGKVSGYYGITYFGEGDRPTLDGLLEWSKRSWEAREKAHKSGEDILSTIFNEDVSETDKEILLAWGYDRPTNKSVFYFSFFYLTPEGFAFKHGGAGVPDCIAESYRAGKNVEGQYGVRDLKFEGPVLTSDGPLVEFTDGENRYFARTSFFRRSIKTYSEADIPKLAEGESKLLNHPVIYETWEDFFEELPAYKE